MEAFFIGLGIAFVIWGAGYVSAAEISILVLIESMIGLFWPCLVLDEVLTQHEIIDGITVLGSVVAFALVSRRRTPPSVSP